MSTCKALVVLALAFWLGCSAATDVSEPTAPSAIYISLYSANHPAKSQPMLINVVYEPDEVMHYMSQLQTREEAELPVEHVTRVYYLQLEFVKDNKSKYADVLYVTTSNNKAYFKPFKMESRYGFDEFDDAVQQSLLHDIGTADWYIASAELPI